MIEADIQITLNFEHSVYGTQGIYEPKAYHLRYSTSQDQLECWSKTFDFSNGWGLWYWEWTQYDSGPKPMVYQATISMQNGPKKIGSLSASFGNQEFDRLTGQPGLAGRDAKFFEQTRVAWSSSQPIAGQLVQQGTYWALFVHDGTYWVNKFSQWDQPVELFDLPPLMGGSLPAPIPAALPTQSLLAQINAAIRANPGGFAPIKSDGWDQLPAADIQMESYSIKDYPNKCPRCGGPAYIGLQLTDCLRKCS